MFVAFVSLFFFFRFFPRSVLQIFKVLISAEVLPGKKEKNKQMQQQSKLRCFCMFICFCFAFFFSRFFFHKKLFHGWSCMAATAQHNFRPSFLGRISCLHQAPRFEESRYSFVVSCHVLGVLDGFCMLSRALYESKVRSSTTSPRTSSVQEPALPQTYSATAVGQGTKAPLIDFLCRVGGGWTTHPLGEEHLSLLRSYPACM